MDSITQIENVQQIDRDEVVKLLREVIGPGVVEIRAHGDVRTSDGLAGNIVSGYFNSPESAAKAVSTITHATAVYFTPNLIDPELFHRSPNRLRVAGKGDTTSNLNVLRRRWLLVDLDPARPSGVSATKPQHEASLTKGMEIVASLAADGWPAPIVNDSGNGCHLMYAVDLPAVDGGLVARCLKSLAARFDGDDVHVDTSIANASRIFKLTGTMACKGPNTPETPHRPAKVISLPREKVRVTATQLEALGGVNAPKPETNGKASGTELTAGSSFDIEAFITTYELDVEGPFPWECETGAGRKWVFRGRSPLCGDHGDDTAAGIFQQANGAVFAKCHHDRCDWGLPELLAHYRSKFLNVPVGQTGDAETNGEDVVVVAPPAPVVNGPVVSMEGKPPLVLPGGGVSVSEVGDKLGKLLDNAGRYFLRASAVTTVHQNSQGHHELKIIKPPAFISAMEQVCQPGRGLWNAKEMKWEFDRATCPKSVSESLLECWALRQALPPIRVLSECPVLLEENDNLVQVTGYHRASGTLAIAYDVPKVSLGRARELFDELLFDFDFASPGDRSRALAAIFTPALIMGDLLGGRAPVVLSEADESQAGKGYFNKLIAAVYNQRPSIVTRKTGGVGSFDENLSYALLAGKSFISIDNVRGKLDSQLFESCLTEDEVIPRVPHGKLGAIDPTAFCFSLTSNRAELTPDLVNRSSAVRLLKRPAGYQYQSYSDVGGFVLERVQANKAEFLGAVFAVVRAWFEADRPRLPQEEAGHDFRAWARVAGWIVQKLLDGGRLMEGHREAQVRMSSGPLTWLRDLAFAVKEAELLDRDLNTAELFNLLLATDLEIPNINRDRVDLSRTEVKTSAALGIGTRLGRCFRVADEVTIDRLVVRKICHTDLKYRVKTFYRFSISHGEPENTPPMGTADTVLVEASCEKSLRPPMPPVTPPLTPSLNVETPPCPPSKQESFQVPPNEVLESNSQKLREHEGHEGVRGGFSETTPEFEAAGENFKYFFWKNGTLAGEVVSFDTETTLIDESTPGHIPTLVLATASDGEQHCVIHPAQLGDFILAHADRHFVCHHVAFDFWVVEKFLGDANEAAKVAWWQVAESGRLHDTMLLDGLVRLARRDEFPRPRGLDLLAKQYAGMTLDKEAGADPENDIPGYRLRYAELIEASWDKVLVEEPGFFEYAVLDAIATYRVYRALEEQAIRLAEPHAADMLPGAAEQYGLLTETLQVQAAITLAELERNGLAIDREQATETERLIREKLDAHVAAVDAMEDGKGIFRRDKAGKVLLSGKSKAPSKSDKAVRQLLANIVKERDDTITVPLTATGQIKLGADFWTQHINLHPFICHWLGMVEASKLLSFFAALDSDRVHPRYTTQVRTGRTSARGPNIQNLPRATGFREMVVASPGTYLLAVDYSFVELRTLAAVCEKRYGQSTLADVIRDGVDPHENTAAMFERLSLKDFQALKKTDPTRYKQARQRAKAVNFGLPGGLGVRSLVSYAKTAYEIDLTEEDATALRTKLITEVYPELEKYLSEDSFGLVAYNLHCDRQQIVDGWSEPALRGARRVVFGETHKSTGEPYNPRYIESVWKRLAEWNQNPDLADAIATRDVGYSLRAKIFGAGVATLTGRIRGHVSFTQGRNTPFQGLAADGAKLALWRLLRAGYRIVAFIHDEIVIELPEDTDHAAEAKRIDEIMCSEMRKVTGNVPIACEYALSKRWYKGAEAVFEDGKLLPWEPPA